MSIRKYKDDYEMVRTKDESGRETLKPVYRGDYFEVSLDEKGLRKFKSNSLLLLAVILVLHSTAGFINNQGMYQFYISLPYVFSFLALFYLGWGILRIPKEQRLHRREDVDLSFKRMKTASNFLLILFSIGVMAEIAFLLFTSSLERRVLEYLYLSLEALSAIAIFILIRVQKPIRVQTSPD